MSETIQKHAGTIALVVAILALVNSMVPQIQDLMSECWSCASEEHVKPASPAGGIPGSGGMGPGPMMGGGMGPGPMMGRGMMMAPSKEYKEIYAERVKLYEDAMKSAQGDRLLELRCGRDVAKLMCFRLEQGGRRVMAGTSEAFLKMRLAASLSTSTALDKNQAALDYQQALDRMRGDREAFIGTVAAFKDYPAKPITDDDLVTLLAAEAPQEGLR